MELQSRKYNFIEICISLALFLTIIASVQAEEIKYTLNCKQPLPSMAIYTTMKFKPYNEMQVCACIWERIGNSQREFANMTPGQKITNSGFDQHMTSVGKARAECWSLEQ